MRVSQVIYNVSFFLCYDLFYILFLKFISLFFSRIPRIQVFDWLIHWLILIRKTKKAKNKTGFSKTLQRGLPRNLIISYQFFAKTWLVVSSFFSVGAAETEIAWTRRICPIDVIDIVPTAVLHLNVDVKMAAIWTPAKTRLKYVDFKEKWLLNNEIKNHFQLSRRRYVLGL